MTSFPGSPRLIKGAIVGLDPVNPLASVVVFQYNPDTMTRRLESRAVSIEIDALDQLEQADPLVTIIGTYPTLATPFSKDWPLLFNSSQATKSTTHR
jgi:hypothetical protein